MVRYPVYPRLRGFTKCLHASHERPFSRWRGVHRIAVFTNVSQTGDLINISISYDAVRAMKMTSRILMTCAAVAGFFTGSVLMFAPRKSNPPVIREHTIQANTSLTPAAASVLSRACMNCHSNETKWPLYSYVPPLSWMVVKDVETARKAMNFSEWSVTAGRRPGLEASYLAASCTDMQVKRMPTEPYLLVHPEARLSKGDIDGFCAWTRDEIVRLKDRRRTLELRASHRDHSFTKGLQIINQSNRTPR